jgi:ABC-type antimicrobial peptide transport system permease subunit
VTLFEDLPLQADYVYFQLDDPDQLAAINDSLTSRFPYLETATTDDLRQSNEDLVEQIAQLVTIMGLVSLLIGSIGIVNTMQVIVRRRMVEVAVLKTIGLQAGQVTLLFLTEAFIMGIIGALVGIVLGWGATFAIRGSPKLSSPPIYPSASPPHRQSTALWSACW